MYRHTKNNMYRGSVFFLAKAIVELPVQLINSLLAAAIMPTLAGFQLDGGYRLPTTLITTTDRPPVCCTWIFFYQHNLDKHSIRSVASTR